MDHVEGQVNFGDTKAGLLLAADSILLAALASVVTADKPGFSSFAPSTKVLIGLSFCSLLAALLLALGAILPSRANLYPEQIETSLTNYSVIAGNSFEEFQRAALEAAPARLDADIAQTIHGKSTWARHKFRLLWDAAVATGVGATVGFVAAVSETVAIWLR